MRGRPVAAIALLLCASSIAASHALARSPTQAGGGDESLRELYEGGKEFAEFLRDASRRRQQWHDNYGAGEPAQSSVDIANDLGTRLRLLVIAEDWCGDSVHTVPYLARLVEQSPSLEMRVIDSEVGADLMASHPTPDGRGATPTVILLDSEYREVGSWVERPSVLQEWFLANEDSMPRRKLFDDKYAWYEEDRGAETVDEVVALARAAAVAGALQLIPQRSGTSQLLQAISPVSEEVVWASGHGGTWARTLDGGGSWSAGVVEGAADMQFRDVHAVGAETAYLLAAGPGDASRIYRTDDGGASWDLQFRNAEEAAFFDCFDFWDARRGIAFSDSVDGAFVIVRTDDGGATWERVPAAVLPPALDGEGSFAASGTCLVTGADGRAWIGTGAATTARVLRTDDWGATWSVADLPVVAGSSAGLASLVFADAQRGVALGGDISGPDLRTDNVARTADGGVTWELAGRPSFTGAVYGAAHVPAGEWLVAVGPNGISVSPDFGGTWRALDERSHWAVAFATERIGWAVGPEGRITALRRERP